MVKFEDVQNQTTVEYFKGNEFSIDAFNKKYTVNESETYVQAVKRVCDYIASVEPTKELREYWSDRWFDEIYDDWWQPSGSIMQGANSGRKISLCNCFSAETQFITNKGVKSFNDFKNGDSVEVLSNYGGFKPAIIRNFGTQKLYKLIFSRNNHKKEVFATADHQWRVLTKESIHNVASTELKPGDELPYIKRKYAKKNRYVCRVGIVHGLVFGDGYFDSRRNICVLDLCDDSKPYSKYFSGFHVRKYENITKISYLPNYMKKMPNLEEANSEYILGFLAGWFAADGTIDMHGRAELFHNNFDNLAAIKSTLESVGIYTSEIRLVRETSPFDASYAPLYGLHFIKDTLFLNLFLKDQHKKNFLKASQVSKKRDKSKWKFVSIEDTDRIENVWCVEEPECHNFTLSGGLNTHNCTTLSLGTGIEGEEWDNLESIIRNTAYTVAKTAAYRQGLGVDFSRLRPKGTKVMNSANESTGSIHWMKFIDSIGYYVGQKGRIPAMLFSLSCSHPDIEDFIKIKSDYTSIQNANISVQCLDAFYDAVKKDADWHLTFEIPEVKKGDRIYIDSQSKSMDAHFDREKKKWYTIANRDRKGEAIEQTIKARYLMELIAKNMHANAEPGIQNIDVARKYSNSDYVYNPEDEYDSRIVSTNACCIVADSKIMTNEGWLSIKEIYDRYCAGNKSLLAMSYNIANKQYELKPILNAWQQRNDPTVELLIEEGGKQYKLECSADHKILTKNRGYVESASLTIDDDIMIFG